MEWRFESRGLTFIGRHDTRSGSKGKIKEQKRAQDTFNFCRLMKNRKTFQLQLFFVKVDKINMAYRSISRLSINFQIFT